MIRPGGVGLQQQQQVPSMQATATGGVFPDVDMSHLSEEERMLIESVMAKAQMEEQPPPPSSSSLQTSTLPPFHSRYIIELNVENYFAKCLETSFILERVLAPFRSRNCCCVCHILILLKQKLKRLIFSF